MTKKYKGVPDFPPVTALNTPAALKCTYTHPPVDMGGLFKVSGGSCITPSPSFDIYVGFDYGIQRTSKAYPWEKGEEFLFHIQDGSVPTSVGHTKELIKYLIKEGTKGKRIHLGCIGGHGRTGLILAALYKEVTGEVDAITHIRKVYCTKAVETLTQVAWLHDNFGIKKVDPSKKPYIPPTSSLTGGSGSFWGDTPTKTSPYTSTSKYTTSITPVAYSKNIWGVTPLLS